MSPKMTIPCSSGTNVLAMLWTSPTTRPPTTAPRKLPRPPSTTMTNAGMITALPIETFTFW